MSFFHSFVDSHRIEMVRQSRISGISLEYTSNIEDLLVSIENGGNETARKVSGRRMSQFSIYDCLFGIS